MNGTKPMLKRKLMFLLPVFVMAICGCAPRGVVRAPLPVCPNLQPVPASLMQPPTTESKVRAELFEQVLTPTHR